MKTREKTEQQLRQEKKERMRRLSTPNTAADPAAKHGKQIKELSDKISYEDRPLHKISFRASLDAVMTTLCLIVIVILILFLCVLVPDVHKKQAAQETTEVSWLAEPGEILQEVPDGSI
ncbi:MAG: hypothetical protein IKX10_10830 [Lachnospiraceae bacterium]|nr:hypothetical protein [Lachnospiraceae bacterium]